MSKTVLTEADCRELLTSVKLPVAPGKLVTDWVSAREAAVSIGYPVVLKVCSKKFLHKSEVEGVRLGLGDESTLLEAFEDMSARFPGEGFLIERMMPKGLELIIGWRRDPIFGPVVMVGSGGIAVEVLKDVAFRLCPINEEQALSMLRELKTWPLFGGFRGQPPVDRGAIAAFLSAMSRLALSQPQIVELECNPVIAYPDGVVAVDARGILGQALEVPPKTDIGEGIEGFFTPSSVAVVGASSKPKKGGTAVLTNMLTHGYKGKLFAVNPYTEEVQGVPSFPSVAALPEPVELVIAVVPREHIPQVVRDCGVRGVKCLIVASGGFADIGEEGRALQDEVVRLAGSFGIRLMGPNSIGTIDTQSGVVTSITTLDRIPPGRVSYVGQTGVFASGFAASLGKSKGTAIRRIACLGNKADVCESDVLACLAKDESTSVIALYLEGVKRPMQFVEVLRKTCAIKPVIVLKGGKSDTGASAVASHTGALAGDRAVFDAVMRQLGAIPVGSFEEMFDVAKAFALAPVPSGNGLGVVSISGVGCVLSADLAEESGLEIRPLTNETEAKIRAVVPAWAPVRNPVDIWSAIESKGAYTAYHEIAQAVLDQHDVHSLLLIFVWILESRFEVEKMARSLREQYPSKPIFAVFMGGAKGEVEETEVRLESHGIPVYSDISRAMRALGALVRRLS